MADTAGPWSAAGVTLPWVLGALGIGGACVLTWRIGRQSAGRAAGLLAAPALAGYGPLYCCRAALPVTGLLLCLLLGGLAAALHAAERYRLPWWAAAGGLLGGAGLLHPACHAAVAVLALWIPLAGAGGRRRRRNALLLLLAGWAVVAGVGTVAAGGPAIVDPACPSAAGDPPLPGWTLRPGHVAVPAALGLLLGLRFRRRPTLLLALPTAACATAGLAMGAATDLHRLLPAPMIIVWAAAGVVGLAPSPRRPWTRAAVAWGTVVLLSWALCRLKLVD